MTETNISVLVAVLTRTRTGCGPWRAAWGWGRGSGRGRGASSSTGASSSPLSTPTRRLQVSENLLSMQLSFHLSFLTFHLPETNNFSKTFLILNLIPILKTQTKGILCLNKDVSLHGTISHQGRKRKLCRNDKFLCLKFLKISSLSVFCPALYIYIEKRASKS